MLVWLGKTADRFRPTPLGALTLTALAGCALLLATADSVLWLGIALFGLRLCGQGMLSHLAMTLMARWFSAQRGRALGLIFLGYPTGEALLPMLVAVLLGLFAWHQIWVGIALVLLLVPLPLLLGLGHAMRRQGALDSRPACVSTAAQRAPDTSWTRAEVVRDVRFYALLPGLMATPFVITGVLFHQVDLVQAKAWTLANFAACYPLYAACATAVALACGGLIDRYGAIRLLPYYLLPLALGLLLLSIGTSLSTAAVFMALMGATSGGATLLFGAIWAELYGTAHLGAIRALATALQVLATALAPAILGWLIDSGLELNALLEYMSLFLCICTLGLVLLLPSLLQHRARTLPTS
jgi:MFS family permease